MKRFAILALAGLLAGGFAFEVQAIDQVKTTGETVTGTVESVAPVMVVVQPRSGPKREIQVNEIEYIAYDQEPAVLKTARGHITSGRYEDALDVLSELNVTDLGRRQISQDVEYYRAYCSAQMALVGNGDINDAGRMVLGFVKANNDSYHYFDAQMLFGDLAEAAGNPAAAQGAYKAVGQQAPWQDYRARAAVALGRSYLGEGKTTEASNLFKAALNTPDTVPGVQAYKQAAELGEARCMAANNQLEPAIDKIETVIRQADPDNSGLLAEAYNALGASYRASGKPKDALLAFLHVHLVYFNSPQNHIEALQNLVELWNEQNMPERSNEAAAVLRDRYKRSPR